MFVNVLSIIAAIVIVVGVVIMIIYRVRSPMEMYSNYTIQQAPICNDGSVLKNTTKADLAFTRQGNQVVATLNYNANGSLEVTGKFLVWKQIIPPIYRPLKFDVFHPLYFYAGSGNNQGVISFGVNGDVCVSEIGNPHGRFTSDLWINVFPTSACWNVL